LRSPNRFLAAAYEANAVVARAQNRIEDARGFYGKALAIDATGKGRGPVDQSITLTLLANLEFADGDYVAAQQQAQAIVDLAKRDYGDIKANLAPALRLVAFAAARSGDLDGAARLINEPLDAEVSSADPMRAALAHYARGRVATLRLDFARAQSELDLADVPLMQSPVWADRLTIARIELAVRDGRNDYALNTAEALLQAQTQRLGGKHIALTDTYFWLAVAEARAGANAPALAHMSQACDLNTELRAAHPQRLRAEAYRVLLTPGATNAERATALQALETKLLNDKNKKLPLIESLRTTRQRLAELGDAPLSTTDFPILN
jgi:hypothetical protein